MTKPNNFPDIHDGEFAVACAEAQTGIVLSTAGGRALGTTETYRVFSSLEAASEYARGVVVANPLWESLVLDHKADVVKTFRDEEALLGLPKARTPVAWWRRWMGK